MCNSNKFAGYLGSKGNAEAVLADGLIQVFPAGADGLAEVLDAEGDAPEGKGLSFEAIPGGPIQSLLNSFRLFERT